MREKVQRFGTHENAFGFLRLLFASLVILAHTPELADGDRHREILTRLFGTMSFGELAVDGFFVISGYLIVGSWLKRPELLPYLRKRIARIYPGFVVCCLLCIFVVAPLGGAVEFDILNNLLKIAKLAIPEMPGAFAGTHWPVINGSAWTIAYEFRCYLLVIFLGWSGLLKRQWALASLAGVIYLGYMALPDSWVTAAGNFHHSNILFGDLRITLRLTAVFLVGAVFFVRPLKFNSTAVVAACLLMLTGLCFASTAHAAVAIFGGYLIIVFAHQAKGVFTTINNRNDISYGVYLYAWPVEKLLLWYFPGTPLIVAGAATLAFSCAFGWASWRLIEKPALAISTRRYRAAASASVVGSEGIAFSGH